MISAPMAQLRPASLIRNTSTRLWCHANRPTMRKKATCCNKTMGQSASAEVSTPASADRLLMIATQHVVKARITTISTIGHALPARPDCSGLIGKPPSVTAAFSPHQAISAHGPPMCKGPVRNADALSRQTQRASRGLRDSRRWSAVTEETRAAKSAMEPRIKVSDDVGAAGAFNGFCEFLGALAADQELGAVGQFEPDAPIAAGIENALAVAAGPDAPAAIVNDRPVLDDVVALNAGDRDHATVDRYPAEPDAYFGRGYLGGHMEQAGRHQQGQCQGDEQTKRELDGPPVSQEGVDRVPVAGHPDQAVARDQLECRDQSVYPPVKILLLAEHGRCGSHGHHGRHAHAPPQVSGGYRFHCPSTRQTAWWPRSATRSAGTCQS